MRTPLSFLMPGGLEAGIHVMGSDIEQGDAILSHFVLTFVGYRSRGIQERSGATFRMLAWTWIVVQGAASTKAYHRSTERATWRRRTGARSVADIEESGENAWIPSLS